MARFLRYIFYNIIVRFVTTIILGLNVRHGDRLPQQGPAIIIANHNSHLDTMVLMTLMPAKLLSQVQPVAAADYFLRSPALAWFATKVIGILPLKRQRDHADEDLLAPVHQALKDGRILIFFPEGSRGDPEEMSELCSGIARLAEQHPQVPVTPIVMHGLGKALPKGEALLVPFFCDVFIGESLSWSGDQESYMQSVNDSFNALNEEGKPAEWL
jgi:1-acyl-sn-glycerol-3-phosphate acyltransferase